jgi:hypothetical protein
VTALNNNNNDDNDKIKISESKPLWLRQDGPTKLVWYCTDPLRAQVSWQYYLLITVESRYKEHFEMEVEVPNIEISLYRVGT